MSTLSDEITHVELLVESRYSSHQPGREGKGNQGCRHEDAISSPNSFLTFS